MTNQTKIGRGLQIFAAAAGVIGAGFGAYLGTEEAERHRAERSRPVGEIQYQLSALADRTMGHAEVHAIIKEAHTALRRADAADPISDQTASRMAEVAARMSEVAQHSETAPEVASVLQQQGERIAATAVQQKLKRQAWQASSGGRIAFQDGTGFGVFWLSFVGAMLIGIIGEMIVRTDLPASRQRYL